MQTRSAWVGLPASVAIATLFWQSGPAGAQSLDVPSWVDGAVASFIDNCAQALADEDGYVEGLSDRGEDEVVFGVSQDEAARLVRVISPGLNSGAGWAEQTTFADADGQRHVGCQIAGFHASFPEADEIEKAFRDSMASRLPEANLTGGALSAAPGFAFDAGPAGPSLSYVYVTGWADDPDLILLAAMWKGELQLIGNRSDGGEK